MANISRLRAVLMPDAVECQLFAVVYWPYTTNLIIYNKYYALKMLCFPLNTGIAVIWLMFFAEITVIRHKQIVRQTIELINSLL
jgi:hypothetical protein